VRRPVLAATAGIAVAAVLLVPAFDLNLTTPAQLDRVATRLAEPRARGLRQR
jgi:hypothetical protein